MSRWNSMLGAGVGLWLLAGVQALWIAPQLARLPVDYEDETGFAASTYFRESTTAPWGASDLIARRVDQTLSAAAGHSIIRGDFHWTNAAGEVQFESTNLYGVDRKTRENLPGFGNVSRTGAFLFPLHTQRKTYHYWDPLYIGPRTATFRRTDSLNGLDVLVFDFSAVDLDETSGYSHLAEVPERFRAHTSGLGTMWIEPTSGVVVDYDEKARSYFVDPSTGKPVATFYTWTARYTPQTRAEKLQQAKAERRRILVLERVLPGVLVVGGLACLVIGWRSRAMVRRS